MSERPSVVVVDDATDVRQLVKTHLRLSDRFDVVGEGCDGDDAIDLARVHRPELMLLDVSMPRRDGLSALPMVLDASPTTRVVMFSGFDEAGLGDHARALGASAFVQKSLPLDDLVEALLAVAGDRFGEQAAVDLAGESQDDLHPVLAEHLERFREIFEDAAIGMATLTLDGRMVRVNRHLAGLLRSSPADLVGVPYSDVVAEVGVLDEHLRALRENPTAVEVEHGLAEEDPAVRVRATISPVLDGAGRALYFFLQAQDVSEQRAAETQLRQTEQRFRLLVEAVQDYAIFMLDPDGHVASWNAGAERSKGYRAHEIIGRHFRVFYPEDKQAERHPEHELDLARRDGRYEEEGWRIRKDGSTFWAHVTITAVHDVAGELVGFAKVTRDATDRHRLQQLREQSAAELAEANESLADFLAVTAHELRSPVGVLAGSADTLARFHDRLTPEERSEFSDSMRRSADQLRRLLDDLLTASRAKAGTLRLHLETIQVAAQLEAIASAARKASPEALLAVEAPLDLALLVDEGRFTQMVDNLVSNALKHGEPPVLVRATAHDGAVEIAVSDAGPGVPEHQRGRLFERFGTTTGGTGLGLYIVRELAHAHGGEVVYRDQDGAFVLTLPRDAGGTGSER